MSREHLPNFLYLGPDKAGSSWLFKALQAHPRIHVTPAKDLYFFAPQSGRGGDFYDRGLEWYAHQFRGARHEKIRCELSHDYLFSPRAAERIARDLPHVQLMVCLREPVSRAFSAYRHLCSAGLCQTDFEQALEDHPRLITNGLYHRHLQPYLQHFDSARLKLAVFDDLKADPNAFANDVFRFLNVERFDLPEALRTQRLASSQARAKWASHAAMLAADTSRRLGMTGVLGRAKSSPAIRRLFYKSHSPGQKPRLDPALARQLRHHFRDDVVAIDRKFNTDLCRRWGYGPHSEP